MTALLSAALLASLATNGPEIQDAYHYAMAASGDDNSISLFSRSSPRTASEFFSDAIKAAKAIGMKLPNARVLGAAWVAGEIKRQAREAGIDANTSERFRHCDTCEAKACLSCDELVNGFYRCDKCTAKREKEKQIEALTSASDADNARGCTLPYVAAMIHGEALPALRAGAAPLRTILDAASIVVSLNLCDPAQIPAATEKVLRLYLQLAD